MEIFKTFKLLSILLTANAILYDDIQNNNCIGKHQIPYVFNRITIIKKFTPFLLKNFDKLPYETIIENDSRNLVIKMKYGSDAPTIGMGPLEGIGTFRFDSIYFHWIKEPPTMYTYQNIPFPAELHVMFYDTKYENFLQAIDHRNSIVVMAFGLKGETSFEPFQIGYDGLLENLKYVRNAYGTTVIRNHALMDLILDELDSYYVYNGSLVRYACGNDVIWIDFSSPIIVDRDIIKEFQLLKAVDEQPLMKQFDVYPMPNGYVLKPYEAEVHDKLKNYSLIKPAVEDEDVDYSLDNLFNQGHVNLSSKMKMGVLIFILKLISFI